MQLVPMAGLKSLQLSKTKVTAAGVQAFHEQRPDVAITGDFNIPAEPATPPAADASRTIRVGSDPGMVATLKDALDQADGGDTIEIATDEPLMITEPLVWNKPGPLPSGRRRDIGRLWLRRTTAD